ncbi:DUF418 domain-containing protein [Clavibacter zhangzhiyongii]|uniref:DUF418 domain-containing protein n=1 Tax=Clavibacter zhangzhiyongii TaxID=2768071 RepID=A0A7L7Z4Y0_9MICO|nr:DUF418 domain-containing protein [Clavibacter zhangzhiyongii]QOD44838.1 DUF418 domain-containing protein [Clavibacter zhangzhiyongii]
MTPSPDSPAPAAYVPPVPAGERMLAPDLLRGIALLGIALANSVYFIADRPLGPLARPTDGTALDHVADALVGTLVDNRAFPLFTMLFAYGFTVILRRQAAAGVDGPRARRLLLRRSLGLMLFGALHVILLFEGDILLGYGILGLALAAMYRAPDRAYRALAWSTAIVFLLVAGTDGLTADAGTGSLLPGDDGTFLGDLAGRAVTLGVVLVGTPVLVGALVPLAAIGVLLGRRGVLEDPVGNLPLLRRLALVGMPVSVLGALPLVVVTVGAVDADPVALYLLGVLHGATGVAGALGLLGIVGWAVAVRAHRGDPAPGPVLGALIAVGRRSMTCYLLQSLLFAILLEPWSLGLGVGAGTARIALIAVAVWLVTVAVAVALERRGMAGPAERAIRRLAYGRPPARPTTAGPAAPVSAG